jgi:hypothetical protein
VVVTAVAVALGGVAAWQFTSPPARSAALAGDGSSQPAATGRATPTKSTPTQSNPTQSTPTQSAATPATATPSASTVSPATSASPPSAAGGPIVIGTGAAQQPGASQVAAFFGNYFAAINDRDYETYMDSFDDQARPDYTERQFRTQFQTTTDTAPMLVALAPSANAGWAATVTFTSHQSPAASATHTSCTNWDLTYYLEPSGTTYLIVQPPAPQLSPEPC